MEERRRRRRGGRYGCTDANLSQRTIRVPSSGLDDMSTSLPELLSSMTASIGGCWMKMSLLTIKSKDIKLLV